MSEPTENDARQVLTSDELGLIHFLLQQHLRTFKPDRNATEVKLEQFAREAADKVKTLYYAAMTENGRYRDGQLWSKAAEITQVYVSCELYQK